MLKSWWQQRQERERQILIIAGISIVFLLLWAFGWHPLSRSRALLRQTIATQQETLATMQTESAEIQRLRAKGVRGKVERQGKSLLALADATARDTSLTTSLKRVEPISEKSVRVNFESADFDTLITWLESLSRDFGVQPTDFSAERVEGVGLVNARVTLEEV